MFHQKEECKTLRVNLLEKHEELERTKSNAAAQVTRVTEENTRLYQTIEEMETKLENHENKLQMMEPNGVLNQLCPGLEFNHTITIKNGHHIGKSSSMSSSMIPVLAPLQSGVGASGRTSLVMKEAFTDFDNQSSISPNLSDGKKTDVNTPLFNSNSTANDFPNEIQGNAPEFPIIARRTHSMTNMSMTMNHYSSMLGMGSMGMGSIHGTFARHKGPDFSCTETEVDCIIEESWSRQMEQEIRDKIKKELKEKVCCTKSVHDHVVELLKMLFNAFFTLKASKSLDVNHVLFSSTSMQSKSDWTHSWNCKKRKVNTAKRLRNYRMISNEPVHGNK